MNNGNFSIEAYKHAILAGLNIAFFKHSEKVAEEAGIDCYTNKGWDTPITLGHFFTKLPIFRKNMPYYEVHLEYITDIDNKQYRARIVVHKVLGLSIFTLFDNKTFLPITSFTIKNSDLFV